MKTVVDKTFPFERSTQQRLQQGVQTIVPLYAELATGGDIDLALKQLKAHLREHVVWERNTVWREMIGLERRGWGTVGRSRHAGSEADAGGTGLDLPLVQPASPPTGMLEGKRRGVRYGLPRWLNSQTLAGGIAIMLFCFILSGSWFDRVEEQNCLALLAFVIIFWALEVRPACLFSRSSPATRALTAGPCRSCPSSSQPSWFLSSSSSSVSFGRQTAKTADSPPPRRPSTSSLRCSPRPSCSCSAVSPLRLRCRSRISTR